MCIQLNGEVENVRAYSKLPGVVYWAVVVEFKSSCHTSDTIRFIAYLYDCNLKQVP